MLYRRLVRPLLFSLPPENVHHLSLAALAHTPVAALIEPFARREFPALPEMEEVETMGGLLTHLLGVVPDAGEFANFSGLKLTAHISDGRRVKELLVQRVK